ncbi:MAG TPA: hypothetical protein VJ783_13320 [Pirellulales bacterium]|nr:hypothetical protein [Pirellulales bacterium]
MKRAKVIYDQEGHAILLPDEFRVDADEVYLEKTIEGFLVIVRNPWEIFYEGVAELSDDFMADGRGQPAPRERKSLRRS